MQMYDFSSINPQDNIKKQWLFWSTVALLAKSSVS